jgi:hypothetical protein
MQLERTPQPGQIWQHFKGNNYKILFVTGKSIKFLEDLYSVDASIKHHETGYECLIAYANNKTALVYEHEVYTDDCLEGDYVIYQRVDPDYPQMWARPLDEFLGIISLPYIEGVVCSNYPRFNRVS